jgi:hypothetical protein
MSSETNRQLLTIGVVILTVVVALLLLVTGVIGWLLVVPVVFLLSGAWFLVLGAMRSGKSIKYERSPFSTMALGLVAIVIGGAWILATVNWIYAVILVLLMVAGLAIAAALRHK